MPLLLHSFIIVFLFLAPRISRTEEKHLTSVNARNNCARQCNEDEISNKICSYEFFVAELPIVNRKCNDSTEDSTKTCGRKFLKTGFLGINGLSPGPSIEICLGDTVEVLVHNKLSTEELSIHWHGIRQKGSIHMDGVSMVTQCSILPYGGFRYKFKPDASGTYFYHAHFISQQADGIYGTLVVRGSGDDPTLERILLLSSRPPTPLTRHSHLNPPTPKELLVNGQNNGTIIRVNDGERYLLRLVNANAYNCPVLLSTSGHAFRVLAVDGNLVQSMSASHAVLFPGERIDISLETHQTPGKYRVDIKGLQDCRNLRNKAYILYQGVEESSAEIATSQIFNKDDYSLLERGYDCQEVSSDIMCTLDLNGAETHELAEQVDERIYIPFDVNLFSSFKDTMTDERYNFYSCVFYPAYLSVIDEVRVAQINGISFKYPSSPLLSQPEDIPKDTICSLTERAKKCEETPLFCECIQIIELPPYKEIELVLIDEGFNGNVSHTFHIHGYNVSVLGRGSFNKPMSKREIMDLDRSHKLARNTVNPPQKDNFVVPNKGYVILRFHTDSLGYWLIEARSTGISPGLLGPAMEFLLRVGSQKSLPPVPLNFPTCKSHKGLDLLFEGG